MEVFLREFKEMDREAESRFMAHQRESMKSFMEWEARQAADEREFRRQESQSRMDSTKEMTKMLSETIRQCFMQPQLPMTPHQHVPLQYHNQDFQYQTPRRSVADARMPARTLVNMDSGEQIHQQPY